MRVKNDRKTDPSPNKSAPMDINSLGNEWPRGNKDDENMQWLNYMSGKGKGGYDKGKGKGWNPGYSPYGKGGGFKGGGKGFKGDGKGKGGKGCFNCGQN